MIIGCLKSTHQIPGCVAQAVTCLATDASLTADPGVMSLIPARSHTFVVIDHEMISTVILLSSPDFFFTSHQQSFRYVGTGLPGLNQY